MKFRRSRTVLGQACLLIIVGVVISSAAPSSDGVPLPPQRIIEVLRNDPNILRAVKEDVAQQAADEGRIVFPSDLSDEALFRMIADNPTIALVASREIKAARHTRSEIRTQGADQETELSTDTPTVLPSPVKSRQTTDDFPRSQVTVDASPLSSGTEASLEEAADEGGSSGGQNEQPKKLRKGNSVQKEEPPVFTSVQHPYARVAALDDLYKQVSTPDGELERFGATVFQKGAGNADDLPMDMPVGPDYVLGPGDGLKIEMWGGVSQRLQRVVDREGRVALPEAGLVQVSGRTLADAQQRIQAALNTQFRGVQAELSLTKIRSVRVYVVGDVVNPGAYDISALSTPLNALIAAGGPDHRGSMRTLRHYRGKELVQEVDVYDLLLRGIRDGLQRIESGDTVLVPPVGREIKVEGMVRRPALYELRDESDLARVLELAGGVLPAGTLRHIEVERIEAHDKRVMLSFELSDGNEELGAKLRGFAIQDGDVVRVSPIISYSEKTVYVDGHVFNPGKRAWHDGMTVRDVIRSYSDLLPEPYGRHAEILRLQAPDFRPRVIGFDLRKTLEGTEAPALQPFDTVRVYSRFEFEDPPEITVTGEVRSPGTHRMNGETRLVEAIYLAGGLTADALQGTVHVYRHIDGSRVHVFSSDLSKALGGDPTENIILIPKDQVVVHRNVAKVDPAVVYVGGRVAVPGRYPLGEGMSASDLVRMAGGLRRGAYTATADLTRVAEDKDGNAVRSEVRQIRIGQAMDGDKGEDVELRDGDVLSIRQISGWDDIGASITIRGEVAHAGTYGITPGERLSSVLKRAGGFNKAAYPSGAMLTRLEVKRLAEKARADLIQRIEGSEMEQVHASVGATAQEQVSMTNAMIAQQREIVANLKRQDIEGRLVLRIVDNIAKWENTSDDIEVRDGDVLVVPKRPTFVLVSGQVYNQAALTWVPGKKASWYLQHAGGPTENANRKAIFIVRADGSVVGHGASGWSADVLGIKLQAGDAVVVPERILAASNKWKSLLGTAQFMSALAVSATVFTGL